MKSTAKITAKESFEVRCHRCGVSFPVGTKRCMYCGEKPSATPPQVDFLDLREVADHAGAVAAERTSPGAARSRDATRGAAQSAARGAEQEADEALEGEHSMRQALPRVAMSLVWVVLLVVISIYRVCSG